MFFDNLDENPHIAYGFNIFWPYNSACVVHFFFVILFFITTCTCLIIVFFWMDDHLYHFAYARSTISISRYTHIMLKIVQRYSTATDRSIENYFVEWVSYIVFCNKRAGRVCAVQQERCYDRPGGHPSFFSVLLSAYRAYIKRKLKNTFNWNIYAKQMANKHCYTHMWDSNIIKVRRFMDDALLTPIV